MLWKLFETYRLSQYTSAKLIQDNPNVTDLSDLNRPTKLAEKFSELYDNEWTDGFDVLTNEFNFKEREAIQKLLDILKVFHFISDGTDWYFDLNKSAAFRLITFI